MKQWWRKVALRVRSRESLNGNISDSKINLTLTEIGLDSLKTMELVLNIEEEFNIEIPDAELIPTNLRSAQAILDLILKLKWWLVSFMKKIETIFPKELE